jgi:CRP-like cAMP-binding protein
MEAKKEKKKNAAFKVDTFLATVDGGRSISSYRKNQKVFSQGDPADAVFYIREGKVKVSVISERGKEAVVPAEPSAVHLSGVGPSRLSAVSSKFGRD